MVSRSASRLLLQTSPDPRPSSLDGKVSRNGFASEHREDTMSDSDDIHERLSKPTRVQPLFDGTISEDGGEI